MTPEPTLGDHVIYRHVSGYDVPAIVTATHESIEASDTTTREIRPLTDAKHLHLTVFTAATVSERGCEKARDVAPAGERAETSWPPLGTWRWPEAK